MATAWLQEAPGTVLICLQGLMENKRAGKEAVTFLISKKETWKPSERSRFAALFFLSFPYLGKKGRRNPPHAFLSQFTFKICNKQMEKCLSKAKQPLLWPPAGLHGQQPPCLKAASSGHANSTAVNL